LLSLLPCLADFSEKMIDIKNQRELARFLLEQICRFLDCKQASVLVFDVEKNAPEIVEAHGFEAARVQLPKIRKIEEFAAHDYSGGEVFAVKDDRGKNYLLAFAPDEKIYFDCELRVPVVNCFPEIGILNIGKKNIGTDYSDDDISMLLVMVNFARLALENLIAKKKAVNSEIEENDKNFKSSKSFLPLKKRNQGVEIVGVSKAMQEIHNLIDRIANKDVSVLITGESGTGKDLVARLIHQKSHRRDKPFVAMNCAALPETLVESELFGHEKGAFTGAHALKKGKFEYADGGTLFLDEIGDMSLPTQAKLLRILEDGTFQRTGSNKTLQTDVRVIAATNKDIIKEIETGHFREDLFYRINLFQIFIPPLRDRREDISVLAEYFLKKFADFYHKRIEKINPAAFDRLFDYDFPGNVRELQNIMERAVIMEQGRELTIDFVPQNIHRKKNLESSFSNGKLSELEKYHIKKVLQQVNFNKSQAAKILGIARKTLREKIQRYGISDEVEN